MWPVVLGLFWKRMNTSGALWGVALGLGCYILAMITGFKIMSFHSILIGTVIGLLASVIGAYLGQLTDEKTLRIFFPHKFAD